MLPLPSAGPCNSATVVVCSPLHHRARAATPLLTPVIIGTLKPACHTQWRTGNVRAFAAASQCNLHFQSNGPHNPLDPTSALLDTGALPGSAYCARTARGSSVTVLHTTRGLVSASITINSTHTPISKTYMRLAHTKFCAYSTSLPRWAQDAQRIASTLCCQTHLQCQFHCHAVPTTITHSFATSSDQIQGPARW